ncbi:hypothetical protein L1987_56366 [Smallanthus sonchifolius]|uniref:Uncharacterized protein n=1 Tax=Smallanthus sonchifolius TaxID=185202 RepID=A0ACB9ED07_9ASTR|nr:hypothetical protein L1987_56366 [Smallanthus sonchifolius]
MIVVDAVWGSSDSFGNNINHNLLFFDLFVSLQIVFLPFCYCSAVIVFLPFGYCCEFGYAVILIFLALLLLLCG